MMQAQFVNFIAFGKRTTLDIRVVVSYLGSDGEPYGAPMQVTVGRESLENPGDASGIQMQFNELAQACLGELYGSLQSQPVYHGLLEILRSTLNEGLEFDGRGIGPSATREILFARLVSELYSLNNVTLKWEPTGDQLEEAERRMTLKKIAKSIMDQCSRKRWFFKSDTRNGVCTLKVYPIANRKLRPFQVNFAEAIKDAEYDAYVAVLEFLANQE